MGVSIFEPIIGFIDGIRPVERLSTSEWADKHRFLSSVASAEPGRWRTSRTPYLRELMDHFSQYSAVSEVIVIKGAQLGFTEMGFNILGYNIDIDPGPLMYVMPTVETVKRNSKIRLKPMIQSTPSLARKIQESKSRDSGNTIFQKDFPGGTLILSGANSASSLRSVPIRVLILDEVDAFPPDLDGEGSPVDLAKARTRTFARKKVFMLSTPTIHGASLIETEYISTSQKKFFVPCPHCGTYQHLVWKNVKWERGDPSSAKYECFDCEKMIEERFKTEMFAAGEWRSTAPENDSATRVGYHINSLYSPFGWYSWPDAVNDWLEAKKDKTQTKLKVFVNTVLGETWKETGDAPEWQNLYNRRESYSVNSPPNDVAIVTAGVDIQKDRIELEIVGWCKGKRSFSIDYRVLPGDTSGKKVWDDLALIVSETWTRPDGVVIPLSRMAIDTGYNTTEVYTFCRRFHPTQVMPVKGQAKQVVILSQPRAVDKNRKGKKIGQLALWNIGVSMLKQEIYGVLKLKKDDAGFAPPGFCHYPMAYDQHYFKMLTAEELRKNKNNKGFTIYEWVKIRDRNEALDCRVYARAAAAAVGIDRWTTADWDAMAQSFVPRTKTAPPNGGKKRKSSFW